MRRSRSRGEASAAWRSSRARPGIGKTRLLAEFARAVHGRGALVLYGRCEEEPTVPYQPFVEALEPFVDWETLAAGLVSARGGRPGAPDADPAGDRARQFDAVAEWLEELAQIRPLVLVLDDLHWAEPATRCCSAASRRAPSAARCSWLAPRATPRWAPRTR